MGYIMSVLLPVLSLGAEAPHVTDSIESGKYSFQIESPDMPKERQKIVVSAAIKVRKQDISIETKGMMGNPISMKGFLKDKSVGFGCTACEEDRIVSLHFLGKVEPGNTARGIFVCFVNGRKAFGGTWGLERSEEGDQESAKEETEQETGSDKKATKRTGRQKRAKLHSPTSPQHHQPIPSR